MNLLYKYAAYIGIAAVLIAAGGVTGFHLGGLSSAKQLSDYKIVQQKSTLAATTHATAVQALADKEEIDQAKAMAAQANQAVIDQQAATERLQATISGLRSQVAANAKGSPTVAQWLKQPIPAGALNGLCFPTTQADACKQP